MQSKALSITTAGHFFPLGIVEHTLPFFSFSAQKRPHFQASIILVILFPSEQGQKQADVSPPAFCWAEEQAFPGSWIVSWTFHNASHSVIMEPNVKWKEPSKTSRHRNFLEEQLISE